jgi:hypothetical protein
MPMLPAALPNSIADCATAVTTWLAGNSPTRALGIGIVPGSVISPADTAASTSATNACSRATVISAMISPTLISTTMNGQ